MSVHREWYGPEVQHDCNRATGRAIVSIGEQISDEAKNLVDVITGDLLRSIHAALPDSGGERGASAENVGNDNGAIIEVGSWLDYACVEECGRGHVFVFPAYSMVMNGPASSTIEAAFHEEGF